MHTLVFFFFFSKLRDCRRVAPTAGRSTHPRDTCTSASRTKARYTVHLKSQSNCSEFSTPQQTALKLSRQNELHFDRNGRRDEAKVLQLGVGGREKEPHRSQRTTPRAAMGRTQGSSSKMANGRLTHPCTAHPPSRPMLTSFVLATNFVRVHNKLKQQHDPTHPPRAECDEL